MHKKTRTNRFFPLCCGIFLTLLWSTILTQQAVAHPISLTNAYVRVFPNKVSLKLEVFVEDLYLFHDLKPNDKDILEPKTIKEGIELHKDFLLKNFQILDKDGKMLAGKVVDVREFEIPKEGLPLAGLMFFKLTYELEYEIDKPEFLTFMQDMGVEDNGVPAETQLRVLQKGAKRRKEKLILPGEPFTVRFNWENPEMFDSSYQQSATTDSEGQTPENEESLLGITSYGAVYSFLYIEPREIRHEVLIPVVTLEQSLEIPREDAAFLTVAEQPKAREVIEKFLINKNPIEVNGKLIPPKVSRIDFYGLDFRDFAQQAPDQKVSMANGRVGVILTYTLPEPPAELKLVWDFFNRYLWDVRGTVYAEEKTIKTELSRLNDQNTFTWKSEKPTVPLPVVTAQPLTLPEPQNLPVSILAILLFLSAVGAFISSLKKQSGQTLSFVLVVLGIVCCFIPVAKVNAANWFTEPPRLTTPEAEKLFHTLHRNIYYAMENREEEQIYDSLAHAVTGEMLGELYLNMKKELVLEEQGGPIARVRKIEYLKTEILPTESKPPNSDTRVFTVNSRWQVMGTVEHWGHIHSRTIEYDADFVVSPSAEHWKISALKVNSENRIKYETKLRGL